MAHIVLTEEQLRVLSQAKGPVDVVDPAGQPVASLRPLDNLDREAIERWKRTRDTRPKSLIPSEQVQAHLRRLGEIRDAEGLDREKMHELLRRMQAGEQV
jgi:hypothetical protein